MNKDRIIVCLWLAGACSPPDTYVVTEVVFGPGYACEDGLCAWDGTGLLDNQYLLGIQSALDIEETIGLLVEYEEAGIPTPHPVLEICDDDLVCQILESTDYAGFQQQVEIATKGNFYVETSKAECFSVCFYDERWTSGSKTFSYCDFDSDEYFPYVDIREDADFQMLFIFRDVYFQDFH
ncbi:MAG: hypothetical protein ABIO70_03515 [Pseudomonadota bacterium]